MLSFGEELKRLADAKGFETQRQLAAASGVSQQMIASLYLDKRPNVSAVILYKLCVALGVSCEHFMPYLADEVQTPAPPPPPPTPGKKR